MRVEARRKKTVPSTPFFSRIRSLSDLGNQSDNQAGRGQILSVLQGNSCSIDQKNRRNMDRPDGFAADLP
jgi:hypothetical protein